MERVRVLVKGPNFNITNCVADDDLLAAEINGGLNGDTFFKNLGIRLVTARFPDLDSIVSTT